MLLNYFINSPYFNNLKMQGLSTRYPSLFQKGRKITDYNSPVSTAVEFFAPSYQKNINNIDNINYATGALRLYTYTFVDIFDNNYDHYFEVMADGQALIYTPKGMNKVPTFGHYVYDCMQTVKGSDESNESTELAYILDGIHDYIKDRVDPSLLVVFDGQNIDRLNFNNAVYIKIEGINMNGGQMVSDGLYQYDTNINLSVSFLGNYEMSIYINDFVNNLKNPDYKSVDFIGRRNIGSVINATSMLDGGHYLHKYVLPLEINLVREKTEIPPEYVVNEVQDLIVNTVD